MLGVPRRAPRTATLSLSARKGERPMADADSSVLPGGVHVQVLSELRLRTTSLCLAFGRGGRDDPAGFEGTAHLLEHLYMSVPLAGGASLSERLESLGG